MPTTLIKTESARPSLTQNIVDLYNSVHVGGAYDAKKQVVVASGHNEMIDNFGTLEATITAKGFKTKMAEQQSEYLMVTTGKETTRMLTSIYGHHSIQKYWKM